MSYVMHRIFCAPAGDMEPEREAFYQAVGEFNEKHAMPRDVLFVAVALPYHSFDKRPFQAAISENIRACRYYIQALEDTWGPVEKNWERDYAVACRCAADPNLPMQEVAVLFKKPLLPHQVEPSVLELKSRLAAGRSQPYAEFETLEEFKAQLTRLLSGWLETIAPAAIGA
ncbi:MAG TPA: hypothetical protein VKU19_07185 [Bryobacteraceae bacterium]|nr:hypothetical protein [Bryobacteraceae bacterium]